jgi:hypothetical protein
MGEFSIERDDRIFNDKLIQIDYDKALEFLSLNFS